jgi:hypothetical protein
MGVLHCNEASRSAPYSAASETSPLQCQFRLWRSGRRGNYRPPFGSVLDLASLKVGTDAIEIEVKTGSVLLTNRVLRE